MDSPARDRTHEMVERFDDRAGTLVNGCRCRSHRHWQIVAVMSTKGRRRTCSNQRNYLRKVTTLSIILISSTKAELFGKINK